MTTLSPLAILGALARDLNDDPAAKPWTRFERAAMDLFGQSVLFTVLVYDAQQSLLFRQHTNQADVSPPGGAKRVTDSPYSAHVFTQGQCFVGSTRQDLTVFSEYEALWAIGCESVLNIPVRHQGQTIGTINLLGAAHRYDGFDADAALALGRLAVPYLIEALQTSRAQPVDVATLEKV